MTQAPQDSTPEGFAADLAMLEWLIELGADEAIGEAPLNRYVAADAPAPGRGAAPAGPRAAESRADPHGDARGRPEAAPRSRAPAPAPAAPAEDAAEEIRAAREIAAACTTLPELRHALEAFEGCALKRGARTCVFSDGRPGARVMVIGEAPGRDEDRAGLPFVGRSGQLLDRMLAAIGMARDPGPDQEPVYITNMLPWRPPQNRDPSSDEIAMMLPFLERHIVLAEPEMLLLTGRIAAGTLLGSTTGITRLRGRWAEVAGRPALPTFHPAALLRNPLHKRLVWADLPSLRARLSADHGPAPGPATGPEQES